MEPIKSYEFDVQVWFEDDCWNYSVIENIDGEPVPLAYGSTDTDVEAFALASDSVREFFNE